MEDQAPGATVYPIWQHDTTGLAGTVGLTLLNKATGAVVTARSTAGITELSVNGVPAAAYRATTILPTIEGAYTFAWDNGTGGAGGVSFEDVVVAYSALTAGPASPLNLTQLRQHVETGLEDEPLQRLLDEAYSACITRFGDDTAQSLIRYGQNSPRIRMPRAIQSVTTIIERNQQRTVLQTLTSADYAYVPGGRTLERLSGGLFASAYWAPVVDITYVPVPEADIRDRITIDLVKLAIEYKGGLASESVGDYSRSMGEYQRERERVLGGILMNRGFNFA